MTTSTGEDRAELREEPEGERRIPLDTFANRVMLARVHAGFQTIDEAATKCGLNRQSWSNWEKGMKPRDFIEVVQAISDGLGVDRDWLLFGGPLAKPEPTPRRRRGDRHGRREVTAKLLRRRGQRPPNWPRMGRGDNDRPRVLRTPTV